MCYREVFNWPHFIVPPTAPQVSLYLERSNGHMDAPGWQYTEPDGSLRLSIAVYFGSVMLHPPASTDSEAEVRSLLSAAPASTVRLDYACTAHETLLLRAGEPGSVPQPFSALHPTAVAAAESHIAALLARDFRTMLLSRSIQPADETLLFAGEDEFYEGFLGDGGLPLKVTERDAEVALLEDDLCALLG